jgi:hypothetical protein
LKSTVPTPAIAFAPLLRTGGVAVASITNTSSSGNSNGTSALQSCHDSSVHVPVAAFARTISPVGGAGGFGCIGSVVDVTTHGVKPGVGSGGGPPWSRTVFSGMTVVPFPEWNTAA